MTYTWNTPAGTGIQVTPVTETDDQIAADTTPEDTVPAINRANFLLGWLCGEATKYHTETPGANWSTRLSSLLNEKEFESARKSIRQKLPTPEGEEVPVAGIVPSGTTIANDALTNKANATAAINLLKSTDRILQCGRGRGKALVILNGEALPLNTPVPDEVAKTAVVAESDEEVEIVMANDIPNLLRAARDEYRNLKRRAEEAERSLRTANNRVQELEVQLEAKNAEIESWQKRVNQQAITTWQ